MPLNGMYRPLLDRMALHQLIVDPDIPNPNLGVDDGQADESFNLAYIKYSPKQRTVVLPDPTTIPIEYQGQSFTGNPVDASQFPMDFHLGNPIGGF